MDFDCWTLIFSLVTKLGLKKWSNKGITLVAGFSDITCLATEMEEERAKHVCHVLTCYRALHCTYWERIKINIFYFSSPWMI